MPKSSNTNETEDLYSETASLDGDAQRTWDQNTCTLATKEYTLAIKDVIHRNLRKIFIYSAAQIIFFISELRIRVSYERILRIRVCQYAHIYEYIHTHIRVYVSLLCIPISFFMWSIVSQTKNIIFLGNENASKRNLHIVKTSCRSMKAIIFRVFIHSAKLRLLRPKLAWSWASKKWKENWNSRLNLNSLF